MTAAAPMTAQAGARAAQAAPPNGARALSPRIKMPVEKYQLKNGLRVLLNPDETAATASYVLGVATGGRHEREGLTGISHMFEHLMFKGTKKYPDFNKTYMENGALGVNAYTSNDLTAYFASFPPGRLELILSVEADRLTGLNFQKEPFEKERQVVLEERRLRVDNDPKGALFEAFFDEIFKSHPYRFPVIGYEKDIAAYTLEKLKSWYETHYAPNNVVLALAGRFSAPKARKLIEKSFGGLQRKKIPEEKPVKEPEPAGPRSREIRKDIQSSFSGLIGYVTPGEGSKEALALELAGDILGAGESSRLHKKLVREKKLASAVYAGNIGLLHYDVFYVFYTLLSASFEDEAKALINEEIRKIAEKPLSAREIAKAQNIKLNSLVHKLKEHSSRAHMMMKNEIKFGDYRKTFSQIDEIRALSPEFVQAAAKKYLKPQRMTYLVLRPKKSAGPAEAAAGGKKTERAKGGPPAR